MTRVGHEPALDTVRRGAVRRSGVYFLEAEKSAIGAVQLPQDAVRARGQQGLAAAHCLFVSCNRRSVKGVIALR